jgi:exonuclease III
MKKNILYTYTLTALNKNGVHSEQKQHPLQFTWDHSTDTLLLQAVTVDLEKIPGYAILNNAGTNKHGTAIVMRDMIHATDVEKLRNGRGIACKYNYVTLVNIHKPSGSTFKSDRERFFSTHFSISATPQSNVLHTSSALFPLWKAQTLLRPTTRWPP